MRGGAESRRRTIRLGAGAEFDLIRAFVSHAEEPGPLVRVGVGDDAAVLEGGWVVSTDLSVEDVHFRRAWLSPEEIGFRATAAALSDLAAMAATPVGVLVSLAIPPERVDEAPEVHRGVRRAASSVGAAVIGGDVSTSPAGLLIDVTVLGRTAWPVLRDGAEGGDDLWVTGTLGASAAAVRVWESGGEPSAALRSAYAAPTPRVDEAHCLVEHEVVDALIDLSDGLLGDVGHLAAASGVRITVDLEQVPVDPAAVDALGPEVALSCALSGGEDYELAFVTDPGVVDPEYFERRHGIRLTRVGSVAEGRGVAVRAPDGSIRDAGGGYDHFGGEDGS